MSILLQQPVVDLHTGDRMTQREFHRVYERTPERFKAELIGGIVYVASPLRIEHGRNHTPLSALFFAYESATVGTETGDNVTVILGEDGEPQPDLFLRILPEFGGQSRTRRGYVFGAPELLSEISHSSRSIDLFAKKDDYARYGVLEYLVLCVKERELHWFDLQAARQLQPDPDGVMRIHCFPGLWVDVEAVLARNGKAMLATLEKGLATPEHAAFVQKLAARGRRRKRGRR
jgi:Uma2 family endonuclease